MPTRQIEFGGGREYTKRIGLKLAAELDERLDPFCRLTRCLGKLDCGRKVERFRAMGAFQLRDVHASIGSRRRANSAKSSGFTSRAKPVPRAAHAYRTCDSILNAQAVADLGVACVQSAKKLAHAVVAFVYDRGNLTEQFVNEWQPGIAIGLCWSIYVFRFDECIQAGEIAILPSRTISLWSLRIST